MLSSFMNNMMGGEGDFGGDEDLGGAGYLGEWNPYLGEYVSGDPGGLTAYQSPVGPVAPVAPIAVDPMCKWCTRVGK